MAGILDFHAFRYQAFAAFGPAAAEDVTAIFSGHTLAESELAFAGPLRRLVGSLAHG
jgi:hypothetical protein